MATLNRRQLLKWGVVGTGAVMLAACAPKTQPAAPAAQQPTTQPTQPPAKAVPQVITLRMLTRQGDAGAHMREFSKRYADESEGKIVVETEEAPWGEVPKILETQLVTDTMVDATWGDTAWWPYLAKRGAFLVIEDYVAEAGMDMSKWFNVEWFKKWTNGKLSGLGGAAGINHILAFVNREWVKEAWGKEPTDDWTMDDYVECMQACVQLKGKGHFGGNAPIGGNHVCDGWVRNWGGFYISPDGNESLFAEEKCQDGIKWLRDQLANGNFPGREDAAEGEEKMFFAGKQAIRISNPGASNGIVQGSEANGIDLMVVLCPKGPSAFETPPRRAFIPYANTFGVYSKTKYPKEAFGLIVRVTSVESFKWRTMNYGAQPGALLDTWYDPEIVAKFPWFPKCADVMKTTTDAFSMPANTRYNEWVGVGANEIPPLVYGEVPYNTANIQAVSDHLQEIIDLPTPGGS
jgi:ABC-type glycerol-3-phosphate transport system substrate-binding protein